MKTGQKMGTSHLGHRYYDSDTGTFITRDPIKDGRNWYSYCDNNPVNAIDADGLKPKLVIVLGDTEGLPLSATVAEIYDRYGADYEIVIRRVKSKDQLEDILVYADAVVMLGHGGPFLLDGKGGRVTNDVLKRASDRRKKLGRGLMDFFANIKLHGFV